MALSRSDAETIRRVVRRLRAEHAEREAAAIERLMQQALVSPDATTALLARPPRARRSASPVRVELWS